VRLEASTVGKLVLLEDWKVFDKYGLYNGLSKLQERLENGLWAFWD
jgi:hypothetical protein